MSKPATPWTTAATRSADAKVELKKEEVATVTWQKLSAAEPIKYLKVAVHGKPKTGKTRFSLTFPPPIYVIETEPGLRPLIRLFPDKDIFFEDVYVPDYTGVFEVDATKTIANIDAAVKNIRSLAIENPASVGTVVVDSVTDIWGWVMEWMKTEILKLDKTARVRQQWDYQYANTKYRNIIMQLISLPAHVVITAQDKAEYAGAGQPSGVFEPSWMWQTPQWVDIVVGLLKLRLPTQEIQYKGIIEDSRHMDEKKQPIAGTDITNITFDSLRELLEKKKE